MSRRVWADDDEEDGAPQASYETAVGADGLKKRVTYANSEDGTGQRVKVTTTLRVTERMVRAPRRMVQRRREGITRFGKAVNTEGNITQVSREAFAIEHPDDMLVEDETQLKGLGSSLATFFARQQQRAIEREHDVDLLGDVDDEEVQRRLRALENPGSAAAGGEAEDGGSGDVRKGGSVPGKNAWASGKSGAAAVSGRPAYVPPALRNAGAGGRPAFTETPEVVTTIRVTNLSRSASEEEVRALFARYGRVARVSLPSFERVAEDGSTYREPRGFAYVAFHTREDAERAMEGLQNKGFDHLILRLEWAKPQNRDASTYGGFRSGYGQRLAQDTRQAYTTASNRTTDS